MLLSLLLLFAVVIAVVAVATAVGAVVIAVVAVATAVGAVVIAVVAVATVVVTFGCCKRFCCCQCCTCCFVSLQCISF